MISLTKTNKKFIKNSRNIMDYDDMLNKLVGFISYDLDKPLNDGQLTKVKSQVDDYIFNLDLQDAE